jgi:RNA polymerase-binding transcription factor DksA
MSARLDAPTASDLSADQLDRLRRLLVEEHNSQQARAVKLRNPVDLEPNLAGMLLARCYEAMEEIDAALTRMGAGSYGWCLTCGAPIPYERLEVVPAADRCVACQADRNRFSR